MRKRRHGVIISLIETEDLLVKLGVKLVKIEVLRKLSFPVRISPLPNLTSLHGSSYYTILIHFQSQFIEEKASLSYILFSRVKVLPEHVNFFPFSYLMHVDASNSSDLAL